MHEMFLSTKLDASDYQQFILRLNRNYLLFILDQSIGKDADSRSETDSGAF